MISLYKVEAWPSEDKNPVTIVVLGHSLIDVMERVRSMTGLSTTGKSINTGGRQDLIIDERLAIVVSPVEVIS